MSPSATRNSHSGKSSKTGEHKTARRTAVARPARAIEKAVRARKTDKVVRPKPKPAPRAASGEAKQKRVTKAEKTKKSAKTAAVAKPAEARPPRVRSTKANVKELVVQVKPPIAPSLRGRRPQADTAKEPPREVLSPSPLPPRDKPGVEADLVEEYIEDDLVLEEDELVVPDDIELDPIGIPLTLLDPELVEVPRPTPPKPKPKLSKAERRAHTCAGCGGTFIWLSVDGLCFSCLKRRLSQRKREDEGFSGFTPEAEEDDEN